LLQPTVPVAAASTYKAHVAFVTSVTDGFQVKLDILCYDDACRMLTSG